jgi:[acyl-carrier-protein] S-malonyltransferase
MKKITLLFPGQGSQYVGMGQKLTQYPEAKEVLDQASSALDFDITKIMFDGPEDDLKLTKYTQPAIVTHSIALFKILKNVLDARNIQISEVLGHSVGEFSALVAAGSLDLPQALDAVHHRGIFMQEAVPSGQGSMFAILRVPGEIVAKACQEVSSAEEKVMPANFNEPLQTVISGHAKACDKAVEWLKENFEGRQMAMPLKVSAPFHSSLMLPAQGKLKEYLNDKEFKANEFDYIANINAKRYSKGTSESVIKDNLIQQVSGSVLWSQSIESLSSDNLFLEVGPGKVLTGLNKKINKSFLTLNLDQDEPLKVLEEFLDANNL